MDLWLRILALISSLTGGAQAPAAAATPGANSFTVVARLLDAGTPTAHCGVAHFKTVMKYEVVRVLEGTYEGEVVYVSVSCPEMPPTRARGFRFDEGSTHELVLWTAGRKRGGALVDGFEDEPGTRHALLHVEPVKTRV